MPAVPRAGALLPMSVPPPVTANCRPIEPLESAEESVVGVLVVTPAARRASRNMWKPPPSVLPEARHSAIFRPAALSQREPALEETAFALAADEVAVLDDGLPAAEDDGWYSNDLAAFVGAVVGP